MPDFAISADARVQRQLDRLPPLAPPGDRLGLDRIRTLLGRLGRPQDRLPPVLHVAGTNGKGSTCAFLRAAVEAAGGAAHVFTSPHLVRFNERIRVAGRLIEDDRLATLLEKAIDAGADLEPSFFEIATAAALLAFAETPADATILEVGLGGRLDATNIVARPAVCGLAALGLDHQSFLGDTIEDIAAEKAGIARPGVPLVTLGYPPAVADAIAAAAGDAATVIEGRDWTVASDCDGLRYQDARGLLRLSRPALAGAHQIANAGLAVAMLRHQSTIRAPDAALAAAPAAAIWPARLQRLNHGALVARLPSDAELWIDGAHNPQAATAVADHLRATERSVHLIMGLLATKAVEGVIAPFVGRVARLIAVPIPGHEHHDPDAIAGVARTVGIDSDAAPTIEVAVARASAGALVLIAGSLHLAGLALAANGTPPD